MWQSSSSAAVGLALWPCRSAAGTLTAGRPSSAEVLPYPSPADLAGAATNIMENQNKRRVFSSCKVNRSYIYLVAACGITVLRHDLCYYVKLLVFFEPVRKNWSESGT